MDDIRTTIDYEKVSESLKETLGLSGSPVAVKFVRTEEEIPEGVAALDETTRHCQMVSMARKEGKIFYAPVDKHSCSGGAWALGLKGLTPSLKSGEFYFKLGKFDTWAACKRTIDSIPHLESGTTYATMYAPLEKTPFTPTVVLIVAEARIMLKLAQAVLYKLGGRIEANFSGIQSVCADTAAQTYLNGKVNFSLGCDGSRKFSGIEDGEMVMGIPVELLPEIAEAIPVVTGAPGSVKK
ncbi:uncharacterized protein (DUF169 family) [Methanofollis sp. W23]|uniref:DUF169 domain-containing protein n=1 Tax=Methanofollis sp. W23 TaxID=2817849 RepID=UPI001AE799D8|nr:DUF169 domain-containing protein [Methanofollis sp. W23]MBP2144981.1 uncharacterized protein (DUF169 family) [Methanofollis sp. W23]